MDSKKGRRSQALALLGTLVVAIGVTAGIALWVLRADARAGMSEAVKTGGLAGAAVVALYGVWLNDRRRRVEEDRQHVEEERLRADGARISHERFGRAIELLGNDADQVRVGAMHALVGLARSTPEYTQTVIDVLCAYLRRPYFHSAYENEAHDPDRNDYAQPLLRRLTEDEAADDREHQVRLTAHRMLKELLPPVGAERTYDLDLTGASLEYFNLEDRAVGTVLARRATFYGITRLAGAEFTGNALFTGAVFRGRVDMRRTRFTGGLSLREVRFSEHANLSDTAVANFADLRWIEPAEVRMDGAAFDGVVRLNEQAETESDVAAVAD
ncbi:pentapeptide repeat-containing protein [Actinokineospora iranica]|uniref:pentapeptide repeat-containing protein n=1 Tax=Actinokineospora iranica TaxID=1271860 RepID=UPI00111339DB|nr:pentapeptide repeat-containing protein [Actinokineospora iranica]